VCVCVCVCVSVCDSVLTGLSSCHAINTIKALKTNY